MGSKDGSWKKGIGEFQNKKWKINNQKREFAMAKNNMLSKTNGDK